MIHEVVRWACLWITVALIAAVAASVMYVHHLTWIEKYEVQVKAAEDWKAGSLQRLRRGQ